MNKLKRNSSIELLKIFAIFLIIINHVIQSYILDEKLTISSNNFIMILVVLMRTFGTFGNMIFFICSAWFLLDSDKINKRKWLNIIIEIWVMSVIILLIFEIISGSTVNIKDIIKSLFPTTFGNNWYMTCYLLFWPITPILNKIIKNMNQKELLRTTICLFVPYILVGFIKNDLFFSSQLIIWLAIYFLIAYIKFYLKNFQKNIKANIFLIEGGILGYVSLILLANYLGLHIEFLRNKVLHWNNPSNIFIIAISIGLLNIALQNNFKNKIINYISSLSLLIYIIHENILLRTYVRPNIWKYILKNYGYNHIILKILVFAIFVFIFALLASILYKLLLEKLVNKISNKLYDKLKINYSKLENKLLKLN